MNATIPLLLVSTVVTAFTPQTAAQEPNQSKVGSRRPVDVSVEGLGEASRRAPGDTTRRGSVGLSARRPTESTLPLDCITRIADQAAAGCLMASSTATLGVLFPYPGYNNVITGFRAFVGGGENNQATQKWSTVAGGRGNVASGAHLFGTGYATVSGGQYNQATGVWSFIGGGHENIASNFGSSVGGGYLNQATGGHSTVGGGRRSTASGGLSTIAGGDLSTASGLASTIGGGYMNIATGAATSSTVAGGVFNTVAQFAATIGGGRSNYASGQWSTIGGGDGNVANGTMATVGGGCYNDASGDYSTVGGGLDNSAAGRHATVAGGRSNTALGNHSFAAGRRAKADHNGAFVWGDTQDVDKTSSGPDQFSVYCRGGARFFSNATFTTGVLLAAGGSTWTMVSDRDAKENVEPVDARAILDKVAQLPLATWNYRDQSDSIRHMGPMAQDFYTAFGLGLGDKTIDTIDPNGVALAAIQGLNELVRENEQSLADKDAEIEELRARLERLEALAQVQQK